MHYFRRAASRLISTAAVPARSSWTIPPRSSQTTLLPRLSQPLSQHRCNSSNAPNQPEVPEQPAVKEENASSINFADGTRPSINQSEALEEYAARKRTKRLALLRQAPEPKETIFIGNLFYDVTAGDLRKHMEKFGVVERCEVMFDDRGISRGFGYVQFDTLETARSVIEKMDTRIFEGRHVTVQFARNNLNGQRALRPQSRTLYIGNLAFEMTDRDLNELFKDIPNVIDVRVSVDRRTGHARGFAHADFTNTDSARQALEILSRKAPYGRKLAVNFSLSSRKLEAGGAAKAFAEERAKKKLEAKVEEKVETKAEEKGEEKVNA